MFDRELCRFGLVNAGVAKRLLMRMLTESRRGRVWFWGSGLLVCGLVSVGCRSTPAGVRPEARPPELVAAAADAPIESPDATAEVEAARAAADEEQLQFERDRQAIQVTAWQHVKAINEMWRQLPAEYFPGLAALVVQIDELRGEVEQGDALLVGRIDPVALTIKNPTFWRAMVETTPDDPVVALFEQMLWAARGYFDRAGWLIRLQVYGPTLPVPVHRLAYGIAEEMGRLSHRQRQRKNNLLRSVEPRDIIQVIATARSFQPLDPDWAITSIQVRLQQGGVDLSEPEATPERMSELMRTMSEDWLIFAQHEPLPAAHYHPQAEVRAAAKRVDDVLGQLEQNRGAYGERDLLLLAQTLAEAGLYAEAAQASRRASGLRGFEVPGGMVQWWQWISHLVGEAETLALRTAAEEGTVRPVTFFERAQDPEGVRQLPLHPIIADRNLRRLQEVDRRLAKPQDAPAERAMALVSKAETLGHLGRWDEAEDALDAIPADVAAAGDPLRVWLALWSGRVDGIAGKVAALDPADAITAPALPALAAAAQGRWSAGADLFATAAEATENDAEFRTYYALMAAAFARIAREDERADALIVRAQDLSIGGEWVSALARSMAGGSAQEPIGENITEIAEAGRVCEQRFYRAFQRGIDPALQRSLLEGCVATGVVDFVEYTAALLWLRERDPAQWDPTAVPTTEPAAPAEAADDPDWTRDASPRWSVPS